MRANEWAYIIIRKAATTAAVLSFFALCFAMSAYGEEVSGEIGRISKRSISIIYERNPATGVENEILLPLDEGVRFNHIKGLADLKVGDKISVELYEESDNFGDMHRSKKKIRMISFVSPAPPKVPDPDEVEARLLKEASKGK